MFLVRDNGKSFLTIKYKDNNFVYQKKVNKKISWIPLTQQPSPHHVISMRRNYMKSKNLKTFTRRISWIEFHEANFAGNFVAVWEYLGESPSKLLAHGNSHHPLTFEQTQASNVNLKTWPKNK